MCFRCRIPAPMGAGGPNQNTSRIQNKEVEPPFDLQAGNGNVTLVRGLRCNFYNKSVETTHPSKPKKPAKHTVSTLVYQLNASASGCLQLHWTGHVLKNWVKLPPPVIPCPYFIEHYTCRNESAYCPGTFFLKAPAILVFLATFPFYAVFLVPRCVVLCKPHKMLEMLFQLTFDLATGSRWLHLAGPLPGVRLPLGQPHVFLCPRTLPQRQGRHRGGLQRHGRPELHQRSGQSCTKYTSKWLASNIWIPYAQGCDLS